MKVTIKGRVRGHEVKVASGIECDSYGTQLYSTDGGTKVELTHDELFAAVAHNAPFNAEARNKFFETLRRQADLIAPTT